MSSDKLVKFEEHNWDLLVDKFIKAKEDDWNNFVYEEYLKSLADFPEREE